jgi:hypothetical protein
MSNPDKCALVSDRHQRLVGRHCIRFCFDLTTRHPGFPPHNFDHISQVPDDLAHVTQQLFQLATNYIRLEEAKQFNWEGFKSAIDKRGNEAADIFISGADATTYSVDHQELSQLAPQLSAYLFGSDATSSIEEVLGRGVRSTVSQLHLSDDISKLPPSSHAEYRVIRSAPDAAVSDSVNSVLATVDFEATVIEQSSHGRGILSNLIGSAPKPKPKLELEVKAHVRVLRLSVMKGFEAPSSAK